MALCRRPVNEDFGWGDAVVDGIIPDQGTMDTDSLTHNHFDGTTQAPPDDRIKEVHGKRPHEHTTPGATSNRMKGTNDDDQWPHGQPPQVSPWTALVETLSRQERFAKWEQEMLASEPDDAYCGPRLTFPLTPDQVDSLGLHFANDPAVPLHDIYQCRILVEARALMASLPRVQRIHSQSKQHRKLIVVGDVHGQFSDLITIFTENGFPNTTGAQYLFNGDFVDRGPMGVEVIILLLAYKLLYPDSVHLNRGNHEAVSVNMRYGFGQEVLTKSASPHMLDLFGQVWDQLPLCAIVDEKAFVVHGGLFRMHGVAIADLEAAPRTECSLLCSPATDPAMVLLVDALWNDPQDALGISQGDRGEGTRMFGPDVTEDFLKRNGLELVIRSHQMPAGNRGYDIRHEGRLVTVFSASNYCGLQGNWGGLVVFHEPGQYTFKEFMAPRLEEVMERLQPRVLAKGLPRTPSRVFDIMEDDEEQAVEAQSHAVLCETLKELITKKHSELHVYYSCCPEASPGVITVMDWGLGLESVLQLDLNFEAHLEHLTKLTPEGHVDWQHFLTTYRSPADTEGLADGRPNDALKAAGVKEDATVAQDNGGVPEGTNGWPVLDMRNPFHVDGADGEDSGLHYLHYGPDDQPPPAPPAVLQAAEVVHATPSDWHSAVPEDLWRARLELAAKVAKLEADAAAQRESKMWLMQRITSLSEARERSLTEAQRTRDEQKQTAALLAQAQQGVVAAGRENDALRARIAELENGVTRLGNGTRDVDAQLLQQHRIYETAIDRNQEIEEEMWKLNEVHASSMLEMERLKTELMAAERAKAAECNAVQQQLQQAMAERDQQHTASLEEQRRAEAERDAVQQQQQQAMAERDQLQQVMAERDLRGISNMWRHRKSSAERKQSAMLYSSSCSKP
uniref:Serine/threonine-protein phosphatase n=1 Tax=Eutreptiella gymnastica TaxID=73025 RepID=A0A7S4LIB5_9EUGL